MSDRGGEADIFVMNADGSGVRRLAKDPWFSDPSLPPEGSRPEGFTSTLRLKVPEWSPDKSRIAFASTRTYKANSPITFLAQDVFVMNADGSSTDPAWSPDGSMIAFDSDSEIYVINPDGTGVKRLTNNDAFECCPAWSPDGSRIAFQHDPTPNDPADGSRVTRLTDFPGWNVNPVWSPDGSRIAFESIQYTGGSDLPSDIYIMNADGSGLTSLTNSSASGARDTSLAWSPDGFRIAFVSNRDSNREIYVLNADGSGLTNLTNSSAWDSSLAWSPDGSRIAFKSNRDGNGEIYVMNADGSNPVNLTDSPSDDSNPSWEP